MSKEKEQIGEEKDITVAAGAEVMEGGADFLEANAGAGYEHMTSDDFVESFVRIAQPLSPICLEGKEEYNPEAKTGMFYITSNGLLLTNTVKVIPIYFRHEWLLWKPNRGGFAGRVEPNSITIDDSDFKTWIDPRTGNVVQDTYTFFCFLPDYPEQGLVMMSFKSTEIKPAKSWNTMISMVRTPAGNQAPFYSSVWELTSLRQDDGENIWYTIGKKKANAKRLRYITKEEYQQFIIPLVEMAKKAKVDYAASQDHVQDGNTIAGEIPANTDY